jgi:hypothetical protein
VDPPPHVGATKDPPPYVGGYEVGVTGSLVGREEADVDGFHAGGADGLETEVGVFVGATEVGGNG